jgi:hypothetical protein
MKTTKHIWQTLQSGLIIPEGNITAISDHVKTPFLSIKTKAEELEALYSDSQIDLPPSCNLSNLIQNAKAYWEEWFTIQTDNLDMRMLFETLHLDRIATAVLLLKDIEGKEKYLTAFASGNLDFFKREKSFAKNLLWEVEVWAQLYRKMPSVNLEEPPDIVIHFEDAKIGIACKKLYSEKHVQHVLSEAVHQIEDSFEFGIVALNIDDLCPPDKLVKVSDRAGLDKFMQNLNGQFIQRHERHLRKYLSSGRLISALISTNVVADIATEHVRFNNASQCDIWTIPGLPPTKHHQLGRFYHILMR